MSSKRGILINVSGIDGCGKSMQIGKLESWFSAQRKQVKVVKAYDDTAKIACRPFMEAWRMDGPAIMFLFQALQAQQREVAESALESGQIVISDRWDESYLAYHSNFGFLSEQERMRNELNEMAFRNLLPDIGFIIEVPPPTARKRRIGRGTVERFEDRPDNYYEKVQATYLAIAKERGWHVINGVGTPNDIHERIVAIIANSGKL